MNDTSTPLFAFMVWTPKAFTAFIFLLSPHLRPMIKLKLNACPEPRTHNGGQTVNFLAKNLTSVSEFWHFVSFSALVIPQFNTPIHIGVKHGRFL
jgi:hypothetical protein